MARLHLGRLGRRPAAGRVLVLLRAAPEVLASGLPGGAERPALVRGRALLVAAFTRRGGVGGFLARDRMTWLAGGEELAAAAPGRRCSHTADRFSLALTVRCEEAIELHLAAEACAQPDGSVFPSTREATAWLDGFSATRAEKGRAWEPLAPTAVEWRVPGLPDDLQAALEFDSAFRQVSVRLLHAPRARFEGVLQAEGARPLPAP